MDVLDIAARLTLGIALAMALVLWLLAFTGRYRPKIRATQKQVLTMDRVQPFTIGLLGIAALLELAGDGSGRTATILGVFALLGWAQDRLRAAPAREDSRA